MALPHLNEMGWEPVVLAVAPEFVEGAVCEPLLEATYPPDIQIVRVKGIPAGATRWMGIGNLWLRCGHALRAAGDRLLSQRKFDLVLFTTTQFESFGLGPLWLSKFGVPFILDYQDPWINDYYDRTNTRPPGGWLKYRISQWNARRLEEKVLGKASGVVAVSDAYGGTLSKNHPRFDVRNVSVIPFGAAVSDHQIATNYIPEHPLVPYGDGNFHIVYTGRCGPDMSRSLTILFRAFGLFLASQPIKAKRVRFHFIGTDYAPRPMAREWVMPVARAEGVEEYVSEHCYRVAYFDALSYLVHSDALVVVGSNDPTYSASKLYPYILAKRPMLIVFHESSPLTGVADQLECGLRFKFGDDEDINPVASEIAREWFENGKMNQIVEVDPIKFLPYTAEGMTRRLVDCFETALARHGSDA